MLQINSDRKYMPVHGGQDGLVLTSATKTLIAAITLVDAVPDECTLVFVGAAFPVE